MVALWAIAPPHYPLNRYAVTGGAPRRLLVEIRGDRLCGGFWAGGEGWSLGVAPKAKCFSHHPPWPPCDNRSPHKESRL